MKKKKLQSLCRDMYRADLPLKKSAKNIVFGQGNNDADLFFIGEAPGRKEDQLGRPFVGLAGRELDKLLGEVGIKREDVYISSILKYRPPGNRNPYKEEIKAHTPFLIKQIEIIKPKVVIPLGNFATRYILIYFGVKAKKDIAPISNCHGKVYEVNFDNNQFKVMPLYHPAAILYNRKLAKALKQDFKRFLSRYQL